MPPEPEPPAAPTPPSPPPPDPPPDPPAAGGSASGRRHGRGSASWRRRTQTRIAGLEAELLRLKAEGLPDNQSLAAEAATLLEHAHKATEPRRFRRWQSSADAEQAEADLSRAETLLRQLAHRAPTYGHRDVAARGRLASWRQRRSTHIAALQAQLDQIEATRRLTPAQQQLAHKTHVLLESAREAAGRRSLFAWLTGSAVDRVSSSIHEAEVALLQLTPPEDLRWRGAVVLTTGRHHLGAEDPRLALLEEQLRAHQNALTEDFRDLAASVLYASNSVEETELARVRSFRNILLVSFLATSAIAVGLILLGCDESFGLQALLCFEPPDPDNPGATKTVCPVGSEPSEDSVLLVAFIGMTAAALAGAASVKNLQGTAMPYMVPVGLLLLRLPIGVISAFLGIIFIGGAFLPGLSALDSSAQIVAWAAVFGISQEGLTRTIDKQGKAVLENVKGSWREFGSPPAAPPVAPTRTAVPTTDGEGPET
ncbi:hypothetical protein ACFVHB_04605 [Kitasatospora sp. NPDC127111]|uniref:hypothetical protein n=1 Tax=Kitasatospora sp. NPDC127111 TaxID=3345363 RepID=UPI00362637F7